jgi:tetratricopeptide (TPR) repeat protein
MPKTLFYISFLLSGYFSFSQINPQIDSLENLIKITTIDSVKAKSTAQLAYYYLGSDIEKAFQLANDALELGISLELKRVQAASHLTISYVKLLSGDYPDAGNHSVRSIELYKSAGDKKGEAQAYASLGNIYNRQKNFTKALEAYKQSIRLKEEAGEKNDISAVLHNIGNIYALLEQLEEAEKMFRQSLKIEIENNNVQGIAQSYQSIANIIAEKDFMTAEKLLKNAIHILDSTNDKNGVISCLINLSSAYTKNHKYKEAIAYSNRALELIGNVGLLYEKETAYNILSEAHFGTGNYKEARTYSEKLLKLKDSIYTIELAGQTEEISTKYETEKREKEIALLEKQNAEIHSLAHQRKTMFVLLSAALIILVLVILFLFLRNKSVKRQQAAEFAKNKAELEQKALRAQMNPHFLFNSLNSIQRLFVEGKMDKANDLMGDFSSLLRRILNNSGEEKISLKEELETLKLYLDIEKVRCNSCFEYKLSIDENIDMLSTKVPPLIIQPFAENAIWHGVLPKKSGGKIEIKLLRINETQLICNIEDNGIGFKADKLIGHESKGISITENRLGSKVSIQNIESGGTKVEFVISLS